jgi:glutamyl-tRNA synthetase
VFDIAKLNWLNGRYIREKIDLDRFMLRVAAWGFDRERLKRIASLAQTRIERLSDLGLLVSFFFAGRLPITADQLRGGKLSELEIRQALAFAMWELDALREWNVQGIETVLKRVSDVLGKKFRDVARPFYVAVTGSPTSVPLFDAMDMLGRDMVRERLRVALELLGAPSKKEQDEWKKLLAVTDTEEDQAS